MRVATLLVFVLSILSCVGSRGGTISSTAGSPSPVLPLCQLAEHPRLVFEWPAELPFSQRPDKFVTEEERLSEHDQDHADDLISDLHTLSDPTSFRNGLSIPTQRLTPPSLRLDWCPILRC